MAFNFDQFNNNSLVQQNVRATEETQIVPSGYVKIKKTEEREIFQKMKMNLSLLAPITHMRVANDRLAILMTNQVLFSLNIKQPNDQFEVLLDRYLTGQKVSNMFFDPTGAHLLLTLVPKSSGYSAELMYVNKNNNKPKIISKVRESLVVIKFLQ